MFKPVFAIWEISNKGCNMVKTQEDKNYQITENHRTNKEESRQQVVKKTKKNVESTKKNKKKTNGMLHRICRSFGRMKSFNNER